MVVWFNFDSWSNFVFLSYLCVVMDDNEDKTKMIKKYKYLQGSIRTAWVKVSQVDLNIA